MNCMVLYLLEKEKKTVFGALKLVLSWFSLELTTIWHVDVDIDLEQLGRMWRKGLMFSLSLPRPCFFPSFSGNELCGLWVLSQFYNIKWSIFIGLTSDLWTTMHSTEGFMRLPIGAESRFTMKAFAVVPP